MPDPTSEQLQTELDEINAQLAEMVGSPSFSVGGFSVDENANMENLLKRKSQLEWRINNLAAGGSSSDNMRGQSFSGGY